MSNCHVAAGRSLIDLVASRLALRAPAVRAATALTRPNQSAQWLLCGRHTVPTGKMVGPNNVVANHRVERGDHLAHDGHDHNLRQLAGGLEPIVEGPERGIPITGAQRPHVERVTNWRTTTPDATSSFEPTALKGVGRDADERSDLFAAHAAEFGQERDQSVGQHWSDTGHGSEQLVSMRERCIGSYNLGEMSVKHVDIGCEPSDATA